MALLFGREDRGLPNEALDRCHAVAVIPAAPDYSSLNLAQAFLILAYELYLEAGGGDAPLPRGGAASPFTGRPEAAVTETGETRRIGGWNCRKYLLDLSVPVGNAAPPMVTKSELWTTAEIEVDARLYSGLANLFVSRRPGAREALAELERIKGFPVLRVDRSELMGSVRETSLELLEVTKGTPPAGTYEIPPGYRRAGL